MNGKAVKAFALVALGAALIAASSHGIEALKQYAWNETRRELNSLNFSKRLVVAWRIIRGKL